MDLVEVSPPKNGQLPVCKVIDYVKMMYQQNKKNKSNKNITHTKEIKYGFNISDHDLKTKHRKVEEFLGKHYVVKYVLELKGRERNLEREGLDKINANLAQFSENATWKPPKIARGVKKTSIATVLQPK